MSICFREQEIYARDECNIEAKEDKVCFPGDAVNHDGRQLDYGVVENPIGACRQTGCLCANSHGRDFGWVELLDV